MSEVIYLLKFFKCLKVLAAWWPVTLCSDCRCKPEFHLLCWWMISVKPVPPSPGRAAHHGAEGQTDTPGLDPGLQAWFWCTLRLACEQRFIGWVKLRGKAGSSHITQTCLRSRGCALPHQPAELHGALHHSRLVCEHKQCWCWWIHGLHTVWVSVCRHCLHQVSAVLFTEFCCLNKNHLTSLSTFTDIFLIQHISKNKQGSYTLYFFLKSRWNEKCLLTLSHHIPLILCIYLTMLAKKIIKKTY